MSRTEVIGWCPPLHHNVEGAADPSSCTLQDPFVAVIIGASRGIGAHMAKSFAQAGASGIIITGRDAAALGNAKSEVEAVAKNKTLKIEAIICDVLIDSDITKLAEKVGLLFGRIDCLILNSGKPVKLIEQPDGTRDWPKGIVDSNLEDLRDVMNTNLTAPMTLLHFLLPLVVATGDGPQTVIIVSSSAANHTDTKTVPIGYVMSKFANARLAEYVHESYSKKGVSVVAIQPGSVMTGTVYVLKVSKGVG